MNRASKSYFIKMKLAANKQQNVIMDNFIIHYMLSIRDLCLCTVACPLLTLIVCFVTAYIFQSDDIHETHCRVYNIIPSISAITGISPQRYLWRISVAVHIGPRFIISVVNRAYHLNQINSATDFQLAFQDRQTALFWTNLAFWLNVVEISSLCGVTYISNRENYPIHEKLFIIFMVSSLTHMLACIQGAKCLAKQDASSCQQGLFIKKVLLAVSLASTVGLVGFFLKHRFLCHDMAFSWFAFCEYVIALANMAFHITVILDFPTEHLVVARGLKYVQTNCVQSKVD